MSAEDIPRITEACINLIETSEKFGDYDWMAIRYLGDHYRTKVDNNQEIATREFLSSYLFTDVMVDFKSLHEEIGGDLRVYDTRDIVRLYRDWAFLNGFRHGEYDSPVLDVEGWPDDEGRAVVEQCNDMILTDSDVTPQDVFVGMKLAGKIFDRASTPDDEGRPDLANAEAYIELTKRVNSYVVEMAERAHDTNTGFDWNLLGGTLSTYHDLLNEEAYEDLGRRRGRRELITEIQESDMTPNEWFDANVE